MAEIRHIPIEPEVGWLMAQAESIPPHLNVVVVDDLPVQWVAALVLGRARCVGADPVVVADRLASVTPHDNPNGVEVIPGDPVEIACKWYRRELGLVVIGGTPDRLENYLNAWCPLLTWSGQVAVLGAQRITGCWADIFETDRVGAMWIGRINYPVNDQMGIRSIWHPHPTNHWLISGGRGEGRYEWVRSQIAECSQVTGRAMRVLDVGCNCGGLAFRLHADLSCEVVGVDIVLQFVELCKHLPGRFFHADFARLTLAQALEIKGSGFDVVTALDMIEALYRPELVSSFLFNVEQMLRPGGKLIITSPLNHRASYEEKRIEFVKRFGQPIVEAFDVQGDREQITHIGAVFVRSHT